MLLLGLTGSIATGKSSVSSILRAPPYSLPIIDADVIARQVVEPGTTGYKKIIAHFASTTPELLLDAEGTLKINVYPNGRPLNRPALGRRVFGDSEERKRDRSMLNSIVHPAVRKSIYRQLLYHYLHGSWAVVLDIPLLFESGLDLLCGVVMVVAVSDPAIQMARLRTRDAHLSKEDAWNRVASQGDMTGKVGRCEARGVERGVVVWNDKGLEELKGEVGRTMAHIQKRSPGWWAWLLLLCPPVASLVGLWTLYRNWRIARKWKEQEQRERAKL